MKKCDFIIPHLNNEDFLIGIKSLIRNTEADVINKIIVIDGCENDHHKELMDLGVDLHVRSKNLGFAKAMNTGLRLSDAEYVMCANDDIVWLNSKWWAGIEYTFDRVPSALCVNPSSVCDPDGAGGKTIMQGFEYKENYDDEEYARLRAAKGDGWIDGICMWGPVFKRSMLDKLGGVIPGKAYFDERFRRGGGEDYNMNRAAYKSGMRCLGTSHSIVWHWWHMTKNPDNQQLGAHYDDNFQRLNGIWEDGKLIAEADVYGNKGRKDIPQVIIRED